MGSSQTRYIFHQQDHDGMLRFRTGADDTRTELAVHQSMVERHPMCPDLRVLYTRNTTPRRTGWPSIRGRASGAVYATESFDSCALVTGNKHDQSCRMKAGPVWFDTRDFLVYTNRADTRPAKTHVAIFAFKHKFPDSLTAIIVAVDRDATYREAVLSVVHAGYVWVPTLQLLFSRDLLPVKPACVVTDVAMFSSSAEVMKIMAANGAKRDDWCVKTFDLQPVWDAVYFRCWRKSYGLYFPKRFALWAQHKEFRVKELYRASVSKEVGSMLNLKQPIRMCVLTDTLLLALSVANAQHGVEVYVKLEDTVNSLHLPTAPELLDRGFMHVGDTNELVNILHEDVITVVYAERLSQPLV